MQTTETTDLFADHVQTLQARMEESLTLLAGNNVLIDAVLIHSGSEILQFADDHAQPFKPYGHFNHWIPVDRPDQMLLIQPGQKPTWFQVVRPDFWYDQSISTESWLTRAFEVVPLKSPDEVFDLLPATRRLAFLGQNTEFAGRVGISTPLINEKNLINRMDWSRSIKTPYEIERIKEANAVALVAHDQARLAFLEEHSEFDIYLRYLQACDALDEDMPYHAIVGLDEKSAILHYQHRRKILPQSARLLLLDAGYRHFGYASDLTRTWVNDHAPHLMNSLAQEIIGITARLAGLCKEGSPYVDIQNAAHEEVMTALKKLEIIRGSDEELKKNKISHLFFPHGIGHSLGIQVHDVGGLFKDETGALLPPPADHKHLRMTRKLEKGMVYTIEPGIYFIPLLLEAERNTSKGAFLNWAAIDECLPIGGVRWEDNILIGENGPENLTVPDAIVSP